MRPCAPLICLPGLLTTSAVYDGLAHAMGMPMHVLRIPPMNDFAALAQTIAAQLPARCWLLGLSMGSYLALEIALLAPAKVAGLILIGATGAPDSAEGAMAREKAVAWTRRKGMDALAETICDSMLSRANRQDAALRATVTQMAQTIGLETFAAHQQALAGRADRRAQLSSITCPALVLTGEEDATNPVTVGAALARALPRGVFEAIPGAGHLTPLEAPELLGRAIASFLAQHDAPNSVGKNAI